MPIECLLFVGAGGHAKVVFDAIRALDPRVRLVMCDDNPALAGRDFFGVTIQSPIDWTHEHCRNFHVAIGDNQTRERCSKKGQGAQLGAFTIAHPHSTVSSHARVGAGSFVAARAVVAPGADVGEGVIVNHGAVVDHDCRVGDFSHVAPQAALGGSVSIGRGVVVGAGAVILPGLRIGDYTVIGAGAVVVRDVAPGVVVTGVPARSCSKA